jgi:hypothetical protein
VAGWAIDQASAGAGVSATAPGLAVEAALVIARALPAEAASVTVQGLAAVAPLGIDQASAGEGVSAGQESRRCLLLVRTSVLGPGLATGLGPAGDPGSVIDRASRTCLPSVQGPR